ncbi:MAG: DUF302 domain-containing protein [Pseudobacteriovorax sp.]|nr:DUF302 domain-containing protein [Pseudobacteriovorax sp.]
MIKILITMLLAIPSLHAAATPEANGLITVKSKHSVKQTIEKFEKAVKEKGLKLFTRLDHAAAAKEFGLKMPPATVIVFGNPKMGTPVFIKHPTVAIDLPPKAMVWQDAKGDVYFSINSAQYLFETIYPRHGIKPKKDAVKRVTALYEYFAKAATE